MTNFRRVRDIGEKGLCRVCCYPTTCRCIDCDAPLCRDECVPQHLEDGHEFKDEHDERYGR